MNKRVQIAYKDYQFCEKNCELEEILYEEKLISCNCIIKEKNNVTELNFNSSEFIFNIKNQNFKFVNCYNAFTAFKNDMNKGRGSCLLS